MAVSKHQNERPAIGALIDVVAQNVQNIATLTQGLADEADARAQAMQAEAEARQQAVQNIATLTQGLADEAEARAQAVQGVQNQIGEGVFSPDFTITQDFQQSGVVLQNMSNAIGDIKQWQNRFRIGLSADVTIAAGESTSDILLFETPFGADAEVVVFPVCVGSGVALGDLSCKVALANYSGFSFDVYNGTQAEVTIKVGFLAAKVN